MNDNSQKNDIRKSFALPIKYPFWSISKSIILLFYMDFNYKMISISCFASSNWSMMDSNIFLKTFSVTIENVWYLTLYTRNLCSYSFWWMVELCTFWEFGNWYLNQAITLPRIQYAKGCDLIKLLIISYNFFI